MLLRMHYESIPNEAREEEENLRQDSFEVIFQDFFFSLHRKEREREEPHWIA